MPPYPTTSALGGCHEDWYFAVWEHPRGMPPGIVRTSTFCSGSSSEMEWLFFQRNKRRVMIKVGCNAFIGCTHFLNCWHAFCFQGSWANLQPSSALRSGKSLQQLDTGPLFWGQGPFRFQSFRCQQVSDLKPSGRARARPPEDIDQAGVEGGGGGTFQGEG